MTNTTKSFAEKTPALPRKNMNTTTHTDLSLSTPARSQRIRPGSTDTLLCVPAAYASPSINIAIPEAPMRIMQTIMKIVAIALALSLSLACQSGAQEMPMPASQEHAGHHHGDIKPVEPHYPQLGRAKANSRTPLVTLEQVENIARQMNP